MKTIEKLSNGKFIIRGGFNTTDKNDLNLIVGHVRENMFVSKTKPKAKKSKSKKRRE